MFSSGPGWAAPGNLCSAMGMLWYCMGMLFLGIDIAWWAEFGQEAMLIHARPPWNAFSWLWRPQIGLRLITGMAQACPLISMQKSRITVNSDQVASQPTTHLVRNFRCCRFLLECGSKDVLGTLVRSVHTFWKWFFCLLDWNETNLKKLQFANKQWRKELLTRAEKLIQQPFKWAKDKDFKSLYCTNSLLTRSGQPAQNSSSPTPPLKLGHYIPFPFLIIQPPLPLLFLSGSRHCVISYSRFAVQQSAPEWAPIKFMIWQAMVVVIAYMFSYMSISSMDVWWSSSSHVLV